VTSDPATYRRTRANYLYYKRARDRLATLGGSLLEVGSGPCPVGAEHFSRRVCLDLDDHSEHMPDGVEFIQDDFLDHDLDHFNVVCCLQVVEHLPDEIVERFTAKLFEVGDRVVISVPYKWPAQLCRYHVQDPVDEEKLKRWTGREPSVSEIVSEVGGIRRLIAVYEP